VNDRRTLGEVLIWRSEAFCYAAHIFSSGCFRGTRAARCCSEYIEDHDVADAGTSLQARTNCDCLIVFIERARREAIKVPASLTVSRSRNVPRRAAPQPAHAKPLDRPPRTQRRQSIQPANIEFFMSVALKSQWCARSGAQYARFSSLDVSPRLP